MLKKNLSEAKAEHYILGTENEYKHELKLVNCMQKLAQAIGGLRSACMTQFALLKEGYGTGTGPSSGSSRFVGSQTRNGNFSSLVRAKQDRFAMLSAISEQPETEGVEEYVEVTRNLTRQSSEQSLSQPTLPAVRSPSEIFERFIHFLGPSMKSLAYTLSQALDQLPFGEGPEFKIAVNEHFRASLADAVKLYSDARAGALKELYKSKELGRERAENVEADFEEVAASCGHFSFSLQDFAEEMQTYLDILEDLKKEEESPTQRSWKWVKFWHRWDRAPKACEW